MQEIGRRGGHLGGRPTWYEANERAWANSINKKKSSGHRKEEKEVQPEPPASAAE